MGREAKSEHQVGDLRERIERAQKRIEGYGWHRQRAHELKRRFRKDELARIDREEASSQQRLADLEAEARAFPAPSGSARRELEIADHVLADRRALAITAARIAPPPYIAGELGERPSDPAKRRAWDRGVAGIETYRQRHGIGDRNKAFGPKPRQAAERARQEHARQQLLQTQRLLGLGQHRQKARGLRRGSGLFR